MKIFISSVISGMEKYRDAIASAVRVLKYDVVRSEDFSALSQSPRVACLQAVRESDVVVLIMGPRYGEPQQSGLSPTHEEYRKAKDFSQVLVMVQNGVEFEPRQREFLEEVQKWESGNYTESFSRPSELKDATTRALHKLVVSRADNSVDAEEMLERAIECLKSDNASGLFPMAYGQSPRLVVAMASGPNQSVLRPAELESDEFIDNFVQIALFGKGSLFTPRSGTDREIKEGVLSITQEGNTISLDEEGNIDLSIDLPK